MLCQLCPVTLGRPSVSRSRDLLNTLYILYISSVDEGSYDVYVDNDPSFTEDAEEISRLSVTGPKHALYAISFKISTASALAPSAASAAPVSIKYTSLSVSVFESINYNSYISACPLLLLYCIRLIKLQLDNVGQNLM